jgi:predicted aldo/keto reductase-like oxidoreductase
VLLPWNWFTAHHESYAADFEALAALCAKRKVAVQTIKSLARGPWAAGVPRSHTTWYQPLEDEEDIRLAVRWVLSRPDIFLNSVGDVALLPKVLRAAAELAEDEPEVPDEVMAAFGRRTGLATIFGI